MAETISTLSSTGLEGTPTNGGARYTSIDDWEASQEGTIPVGDRNVLECYRGTTVNGGWQSNGWLDERLSISGWVTGPDAYIIIRPAAGQGHAGVPGDGFVLTYIGSATSRTIIIFQDYTVIEDITVALNATSTTPRACIEVSNALNATVQRCFLFPIGEVEGVETLGIRSQTGNNLTIWNCTFICGLGVGPARGGILTEQANTFTDNCTVVNFRRRGMSFSSSTGSFTNNVSTSRVGLESDFHAGGTLMPTTCFSFDGSESTTVISESAFVNYADGDFKPAEAGPLDGSATDLSALFSDDIAGEPR